jgi:hypothetical protein
LLTPRSPDPRAWLRRAWHLLAFTVVGVTLALQVRNDSAPRGVDFHTYAAAARVGLQRGWAHIYDQFQVAAAEIALVPDQVAQPYLSPPMVAWLAAPLTGMPYPIAFGAWTLVMFGGLLAALVWASSRRGLSAWTAALAVVATAWTVHALQAGQVIPLLAIGIAVAWRLLGERRDVAAGVALSLLLLKPNTALLLPVALLVGGRYRALISLGGCGVLLLGVSYLIVGPQGLAAYAEQLQHHLPGGADSLAIRSAFGLDGIGATLLRAFIVGIVLVGAWRLRARMGQAFALALTGSLLITPYLHSSDLSLLAVGGWLVWQEREAPAWRVVLAVAWFMTGPVVALFGWWPPLTRWPPAELAAFVALATINGAPMTRRGHAAR